MKLQRLTHPQHSFGKLADLSVWQQSGLFCLILCLILTLPLKDWLQLNARVQQLREENENKVEQLTHQQKILATLRKHSENGEFTAESAAKIAAVNQYIRELLPHHLSVLHNQWEMRQSPQLSLHLQGNFTDFSAFFTALLQKDTQLDILRLAIYRTDNEHFASIQAEISLQLAFNEE
ncbi:hypothetical protein [Caviibacterium pharyngocola]|uniref:Competence protein C n=1 Tax=Caviibacterium pharyngocola TaxID=28159 RepID=A0A2M8RVQ6_9PAST|nr:hypothetical protein [Caviibacterium pharyngocola]PJG82960.1 hypothetical protein CVP04_06250 [Caviibacterium pharyngocola]